MARVEFLASPALSMLLALNKYAQVAGGRTLLCNLQPVIAEVFSVSQLDRIIEICENESTATASSRSPLSR